MKATGMIRRIDDLGRVVIPKEIRRSLRIQEGDPFEIYLDERDSVVFRRYSPLRDIQILSAQYAKVLDNMSVHAVIITDRNHVVATSDVGGRNIIDRKISYELSGLIERRSEYQYQSDYIIHPVEECDFIASAMCPIISNGVLYGSVILLADDKNKSPSKVDFKLAQHTAAMLACQLAT